MSTGKRVRRTPEEAQRLILDAAEAQIRRHGPAGLRLQEVAAHAGVSHPTVLHHFGNREGLVSAVVVSTMERVVSRVVETIEASKHERLGPGQLLERIHGVLAEGGQGRALAWLVLSGHHFDELFAVQLRRIVDALHALRPHKAGVEPAYEDTLFVVLLGALATFGDAVAGKPIFRGLGLDAAAAQTFRGWLATLVRRHLGSPPKQIGSRDGRDAATEVGGTS